MRRKRTWGVQEVEWRGSRAHWEHQRRKADEARPQVVSAGLENTHLERSCTNPKQTQKIFTSQTWKLPHREKIFFASLYLAGTLSGKFWQKH